MSEQNPSSGSPVNWLFPVIFLSIIALLALYIVRDNYNERTKTPTDWVNKDTRSDYISPGETETVIDTSRRIDSSERERGSQPILDTTK